MKQAKLKPTISKEWKCQNCGKVYKTKKWYKIHVRLHPEPIIVKPGYISMPLLNDLLK